MRGGGPNGSDTRVSRCSTGVVAIVGTATNTSWSITLDSPQTLGVLGLTNTGAGSNLGAGYSLDTGVSGSLTLANTGTTAQIAPRLGEAQSP